MCKDGLPGYGLDKRAWHDVAEADNDIISKALVVDLLDKQNNAFAKRTFSVRVEQKMRELEYQREASFCRIMREWYAAEDEKGLSAVTRAQFRINLRDFLMWPVDLQKFPPYGYHILSMPQTMFEGLLQNIDTKLQLYAVVKGGSMNTRAIGTLQNETFFG